MGMSAMGEETLRVQPDWIKQYALRWREYIMQISNNKLYHSQLESLDFIRKKWVLNLKAPELKVK